MIGIVTGIKRAPSPSDNIYTILSDKIFRTKSALVLNLNDKLSIDDADFADPSKIKIMGTATDSEYEKLLAKKLKSLGSRNLISLKIPEFEKATKKMLPKLGSAAERLFRSCITGAPIVVRFHNDCDGSSGATGIYDALGVLGEKLGLAELETSWRMNRGIGYTTDSFHSDGAFFNSFEAKEKPLVIIIDFGTTEESYDAIKLCNGKYDLIFMDHHLVFEGFPVDSIGYYINPWNFGSGSDYTAGFLACVFAEMIAEVDVELLKDASLIGDYSVYADRGKKGAYKIAMVLDYLTSKKDGVLHLTPRHINSIIRDEEKLGETFSRASTMLREAVDLGVRKAKRYKTKEGVVVYTLDFKHIIDGQGEHPLPGRFSSWLQDKLEDLNENVEVITIVYHESRISVRAAREAADRIGILKIVEELKKSSDYIYSCGGHSAAFSVQSDKLHVERVVNLILNSLGAIN